MGYTFKAKKKNRSRLSNLSSTMVAAAAAVRKAVQQNGASVLESFSHMLVPSLSW